jgi:hypothetical protein
VWILFCLLLLLLLLQLLALFSAADLSHPQLSFSCSLAAASADAACALALACFYSRIALSFTIKAALYNASVMLSGE